ncbi:MAG TPA: glycerol acyltransferase [Bacteroidales bacterium]|nr:glycerol acyltransferase [Bacteroidales bacterium]
MENNVQEKDLFIDIDKVIKSRNSKILKMLPKFIINYIKRIIHQDDLNYFVSTYKHLSGIDFVNESTVEFGTKVTVIGGENLQNSERNFIFASNHPLGGIDGALLIRELTKLSKETKSISNDLMLNLVSMRPCFIGVNLYGGNSKDAVAALDAEFNSDINILFFPAGMVSRRTKGVIKDLEWKNTFVKRAIKHHRDIVPIHVSGRLTNFFYNFANLRKKLGIKFNIELFFLVDELFRQRKDHITITIGKPIPYAYFKANGNPNFHAEKMRDFVYELAKNNDATYTE